MNEEEEVQPDRTNKPDGTDRSNRSNRPNGSKPKPGAGGAGMKRRQEGWMRDNEA